MPVLFARIVRLVVGRKLVVQRLGDGDFVSGAACRRRSALARIGPLHVRRAARVQPLQTRAFQFQQLPHVGFADEYDEDEDARQNVDYVRRDPNVSGSADCERNDFHHPREAHQDEETENHSEPKL